ncbi:MAG: molybdopterin-dependent oxidoreductase [Syntrophorhabdaceae bacterium]|nr:molybdopterin-dependent oxidoreductase [Syntrophorhabdaceae bacterium]
MSRLKEMKTPVFWAEGHPGVLDRNSWEIEVRGLCDTPRVFTWSDLAAMHKTVADARLTSVTRFTVRGSWGGVRLLDIMKAVNALPSVTFVRFWSVKKIYDTSIPVETAMKERTLLAYEFDGEYLEEDYGGPVRAFVPYLWGYKSAKSLVGITLMDHYQPGYWEKRGYTDEAYIEAGLVRDMNDSGRIRRISEEEWRECLDG